MENEIWRPIKGYDGDYLVSNLGRVKSLKNKKEYIFKPYIANSGYYKVNLRKNKISKTLLVHRLMGTAFIPNPENKPEINHLNGVKTDNQVTNLEWVTRNQNIQHAYKTGLMENTRKSIILSNEVRTTQIYSKKLNMQFGSCTEAANYLKNNYFEDIKLESLQTIISKLLKNRITKSKFDFGWQYVKK